MLKCLGRLLPAVKTLLGCALFAIGFNGFLLPNSLNAGGISGLSMAIVQLTGLGSIGTLTVLLNIPLFVLAGLRIGRRFILLSLLGTVFSSTFIDLFSKLSVTQTEPLLGCIYGGLLCGLGLGIVFASGGSTGGSDIVVRLVKRRQPGLPIGTIAICFDMLVAVLNGMVSGDISRTLYSGIAIFISGQVVDAVVYRFDYSRVAWIISKNHEVIVSAIARELGRGATLLNGEGSYSGTSLRIVLTAVKRQQLADLKRLVADLDPQAFVIVQEAHQVLGDGFLRNFADSL